MEKRNIFILIVVFAFPLLAAAQTPPGSLNIPLFSLVVGVTTIALNILWVIAVAFSIFAFVLAGFKFMNAQGDPEKVKEARRMVIWGAVGVGVVVLAWSIVAAVRLQIGV